MKDKAETDEANKKDQKKGGQAGGKKGKAEEVAKEAAPAEEVTAQDA